MKMHKSERSERIIIGLICLLAVITAIGQIHVKKAAREARTEKQLTYQAALEGAKLRASWTIGDIRVAVISMDRGTSPGNQ